MARINQLIHRLVRRVLAPEPAHGPDVPCDGAAEKEGSAGTSPSTRAGRMAFLLLAVAVTALGAGLRYPGLTKQIIIDDEWHQLNRAAHSTTWELLTNYYPRATSIPNNVYLRLLLDSCGWSEIGIRIPTVLATLATFALWPSVVARIFGSRRVAVASTFVFAISGFWIMYGQSSRPYAPFLLLLIAAYDRFVLGLSSGRMRDWVLFAIFAALSVPFHLYALPVLAAFGVAGFVAQLIAARRAQDDVRAATRRLLPMLKGYIVWGLLVAAFFALPVLNHMRENFPPSVDGDRWNDASWLHLGELLTGARYPWLVAVLLACAAVGLASLLKTRRFPVLLLATGLVGSIVFTLVVRPKDYYVAIVFLRYNVLAHLLFFLGLGRFVEVTALRLAGLSARLAGGRVALATEGMIYGLIAAGLVAGSPIPRNLKLRPNNFRLHRAYNIAYSDITSIVPWADGAGGVESPNSPSNFPEFYRKLAAGPHPCRIIESPAHYGDTHGLFFFYQQIHHCTVIAGFALDDVIGRDLNARVIQAGLHFKTLANIDALTPGHAPADFVIIHRHVKAEEGRLGKRKRRRASRTDNDLAAQLEALERKFGAPLFEDEDITVFALRPGADVAAEGGRGATSAPKRRKRP